MRPDLHARIDELLAFWDRPGLPGVAAGVYVEGELVYGRGVGCADLEQGTPIGVETVFLAASLAKQFTAFLAGLMAREGRLSLDDDLRRYVPELPPGPPITFRHAIHHTSGLREQWDLLRLAGWRDADLKTTADLLSLVARQRAPNFEPGLRFHYINTAYTLMAVAIERIAGESFRRVADRLIFRPLGMSRSFFATDYAEVVPGRAKSYYQHKDGALRCLVPRLEIPGGTCLMTTIRDFAGWERNALMPTVGDAALLRDAAQPARFARGAVTDYGFGHIVGRHGGYATLEHAGGDAAFRAYHLRVPEQRLAVLVLANFMDIGPSRIARQIVDMLLPKLDAPAPGRTVPADVRLDSPRLTGLYRHTQSGLTCRVELRNGRFFLETSGSSYELFITGKTSFRFADVDVGVTFDLPETGPATSMTVQLGGDTANVCMRVETAEGEGGESAGAPLSDYVGHYSGEELDAVYRVSVSGDLLIVRGPRGLGIRLRRNTGDRFVAADTTIDVEFRRDGDGAVDGFLLSSERAWNIVFNRLPTPRRPDP